MGGPPPAGLRGLSSVVHPGKRPLEHVRRNVVGYLALFFALGGVAGAAAEPLLDRANSVQHRNIEPGAIRGSDIADEAVGEEKLSQVLQDELDPPTPRDGSYAGTSPDGSTTVSAIVVGWQVADIAIQGDCSWETEGGNFSPTGSRWSYVSRGPENRFLSLRGEFLGDGDINVLALGTVSPAGVLTECDSPIVLRRQQPSG